MSRVPVWIGLDPAPGAWDAWRIAIVGIAGERGLYYLLIPVGQAEEKVEREANRNLWFLLARATGSPAVGVVREFEGRLGSPDVKTRAFEYATSTLLLSACYNCNEFCPCNMGICGWQRA